MTNQRRIRHTLDGNARVNLTGGDYHVEFPRSGVLTVGEDYAAELVENHPLIEWAVEIPDDYRALQSMAAAADTDEVDGNSPRDEIVAYLETLSDDELEALQDG